MNLEITEGMGFDSGFISGYFVTDQNEWKLVLEKMLIFY